MHPLKFFIPSTNWNYIFIAGVFMGISYFSTLIAQDQQLISQGQEALLYRAG